ncbi:glycosyltransferase family 2 protein [Sphingomonas naphthae]|uniref:Glycosyltransferase family 2 protein n=1 Tax=Sphingomonas naphthae TaxID=1813468 RepID=A0ABY7TF74_9SPHN|nr:glycosyltransferase family 2 protein [Sphingomonas naphthae]WCT71887.1 glycosyltransferase family 2 protein [Sphingomonas naphthae]
MTAEPRPGAELPGHDMLIVIPCLNEAAHLPDLLDRLTTDAPAARIVVADGGSTDGSVAIVEAVAAANANVILLPNPRRIQSAGVNLAAARHGHGRDWLVRIDAHCAYPAGYATGLVASARREGAASVVVPMVAEGKACFQIAAATAQNSVLGTGGSAHRHLGEGQFVDHGHHALMRLDLFLGVGGYRETLSHNEDAELDLRLAKAGARIWLEPAQAITYFPRRTPAALFRQYLGYGAGRARTIALHRSRMKLRQGLPLAPPLAAGLALLSPLWGPLCLPLLAWALLCLAAGAALGFKQRSACAMASGVAAMVMHMAWGIGFLRQRLFGRPPPAQIVALQLQ